MGPPGERERGSVPEVGKICRRTRYALPVMTKGELTIRRAAEADFDGIWEIFHAVVEKGDTYAYLPETTREQAQAIWMAR